MTSYLPTVSGTVNYALSWYDWYYQTEEIELPIVEKFTDRQIRIQRGLDMYSNTKPYTINDVKHMVGLIKERFKEFKNIDRKIKDPLEQLEFMNKKMIEFGEDKFQIAFDPKSASEKEKKLYQKMIDNIGNPSHLIEDIEYKRHMLNFYREAHPIPKDPKTVYSTEQNLAMLSCISRNTEITDPTPHIRLIQDELKSSQGFELDDVNQRIQELKNSFMGLENISLESENPKLELEKMKLQMIRFGEKYFEENYDAESYIFNDDPSIERTLHSINFFREDRSQMDGNISYQIKMINRFFLENRID